MVEPDKEGLRVARRVSRWHLGYGDWADKLIYAYLNPETAERALMIEMKEDADEL